MRDMRLHVRAIAAICIIAAPTCCQAAGWQGVLRLTYDEGISFPPPNNGRYVAVDLDTALHVVWADDRDRNFEIYHKMRSGGVWSADERLTDAADESKRPVLVVDVSGRLHLVWNDRRDGNKEIYHRIWNGSWSPEWRVTNTAGHSFAPSTAAVGSTVHLVYNEDISGHLEIMYRTYDFLAWTEAEQLTSLPTGDRMVASIASGPDGSVHVAWWDTREDPPGNTDGKIYYRANSGGWSAEELVSGPEAKAMRPCVTVCDSGYVHIVWIDSRDIYEQIYYRRRGPHGWESEVKLTTGDNVHYHPSISAAGNDLYLAYWAVAAPETNSEIYCKSKLDGSWGPSVRLTNDPAPSTLCCLIAEPPGNLHVAWVDERDGNGEIYYREYIDSQTGTGDDEDSSPPPLPPLPLALSASPNPFSGTTRLELSMPSSAGVSIRIYDVTGRCVRRLAACSLPEGRHPFTWDGLDDSGRPVAAGVYIVRARAGKFRISSKILHLR
jgi:hypothetical protein